MRVNVHCCQPRDLAFALLATLLMLTANPAWTKDGGDDPVVRARSAQILPGDSVTVTGRGFEPGRKLALYADGGQLNAEPFMTNEKGSFKGTIQVPADAGVGLLPVNVRVDGRQVAGFELMVSRDLPVSGTDRFKVRHNQLPDGLYQVAYSTRNDALFVTRAAFGDSGVQSELLKIDPDTLEIVDRTTPPAAPARNREDNGKESSASGLYAVFGTAVDSANETVWVTNSSRGTVAVYRQQDMSLARQFSKGLVPHARSVVVDSKRGKAYMTSIGAGHVAVFDTRTLQYLKNIEIASGQQSEEFAPMGLALDSASGTLYVSSLGVAGVAVIDTASDKVEKVIKLEQARSLRDMAWDAADQLLLVADYGSDSLLVVDPESGEVVHDIYVGASPLAVTWGSASGLAYIANWGAGTVAVADPSAGKRVANLAIGPSPVHIAADGRGHVFVVNKARNKDGAKGNRITRITPKAD